MAERGRRDDRDAPECVEHQQIGITGDDQIGPAIDRKIQEFVVSRIPASSYNFGYRNQFSGRK